MKDSYTEHLSNQEYNKASELWYYAEDRLKQSVERGDDGGALAALSDLKSAVTRRFSPVLPRQDLTSTMFGILGGILHFACRDAGLPPAYLTLMILRQRDSLSMVFSASAAHSGEAGFDSALNKAAEACVLYACRMVKELSLPGYSPLVRRCVTLIQQQLTDNISMDSLAAGLGVTRQYLSSLFHKETGKTPTEYINYERVRLSRYYLRQERFTITQIAMMCGYGDSNYFGRVFKRYTGQTPREYRNTVKA